ncbi:insulinase family protein [Bowmanella pacifica]|uniref:Protease 3 n=1 Tax=Bowmanella pacifica TaxID=502051 RepID=A0A917Z586_9ALTE|nr:insulinase family protein [Bowmanella pacifica]GGO75106.1 peptidase M16 [Bowmanella pacifica]
MITSTYDRCQYRHLVLDNGLNVLLVHDVESRKSAACATIALGHFQDPESCQGLAHLLEHMLFLGCQDYPAANHLADHLSLNGGHVNAWTGTEQSSFYFDALSNGFEEALRQFSAMLCTPLFDLSAMRNELNAIDAEFHMKKQDDLRRLYQVHKETCNPAHPFSKFSVGNLDIFSQFDETQLQQMLRDMHRRHYHGGNMSLCLVSELSLDEQEKLCQQYFTNLPTALKSQPKPYPPLYLPEQLGVALKIVPLKTARRMIVSFALEDVHQFYQSKPLNLISHLLGDEGPGSLLSYLKEQGWATSLSAGGGIQGSNFKDFNINLQLTPSGAQHWQDILFCLFASIALIKEEGVSKWRFEERQKFGQMAFDFHDKPKAMDLASHLAVQLHYYPPRDLLSGEYLLEQFSPDLIHRMLAQMQPQNMRLKLILPDQHTDRQAAWYDTPYAIEPLSPALLAQLKCPPVISALVLPKPNPYLHVRTALHEVDKTYLRPTILLERNSFNFWFCQDDEFHQPKGELYLSFDSSAVLEGAGLCGYKRIWTNMVQERLNQDYYQANIAGLHFHFYAHQGGFSLHTSGFSDQQFPMAEQMLRQILSFDFTRDEFELAKAKQSQAMQNSLLNKPVNRLFNHLSVLMQPLSFALEDMLPIVEAAEYSQMLNIQTRLLSSLHLEAFAHGDWPAQQAINFASNLEQQLLDGRLQAKGLPRDVVSLSDNYRLGVPCQGDDKAVLLYFQPPNDDVNDIALTILVEQLLAAPFFNQLRTEKQLGYLVGSGYMPYNQHPGIGFYIQSPNYGIEVLVEAIRQFLAQSSDAIASMDEQDWQLLKQGIAKQLTSKDTSLSMRSQRLWLAIGNQDWQFDHPQRLASQILALGREQVLNFCQGFTSTDGFASVLLYSQHADEAEPSLEGKLIVNLPQFKANVSPIR